MAEREMTNEEAIEILSHIRVRYYNIFDEYDEPKYAALSKAIFALKAVRHGHWYDDPNYLGTSKTMYFCSYCGSASWREDPYCWHCGSKMDVSDTDVGKKEAEE